MRQFLCMSAGLLATLVMAQTNEVNRYQVIVDRAPFGQVTPAGAAATQPGFATRFQFVGLVYSNGTPLAILNDTQDNHAYFRFAGEMIDDVKVVSIQTNKPQKIVIQQGLMQATLGYEERKAGAATPMVPTPQIPQPFAPGTSRGSPFPPRRTPFITRGTR